MANKQQYTEDDLHSAFQAGVMAGESRPGSNMEQNFQTFLALFNQGKVEAEATSAVLEAQEQLTLPGVDWDRY